MKGKMMKEEANTVNWKCLPKKSLEIRHKPCLESCQAFISSPRWRTRSGGG